MESTVKRWRCDVCGEWVTPADGYVVWGYVGDHLRTGFQIIHRGRKGCDDHSKPASSALGDFLGPDGFTRTIALMATGPIMRNQSPDAEFKESRIADNEEFADFMRRLYVPNYEEGRDLFNDHDTLEDLQGCNETRPYMQDILKRLAEQKRD